GIIFIPLMNLIYSIGETGGAAFPSTHAASAVIATLYSCKMFPKVSRFIILWLFLILISTVVCTFHYTIDIIAGLFSGTLCLLIGKKLYEKIS
nr:phosphatase PAP2 family protein [Dehalococcoidia bacterium]